MKKILKISFILISLINLTSCNQTTIEGEDYMNYESSGDNIVVTYSVNSEAFLNINGVKSGPYEEPLMDGYRTVIAQITDSIISKRYTKNNQQYLEINDLIFGPYEEIYNVSLFEDKWGFIYFDEGLFFNINGESYGPFSNTPSEIFLTKDKFGFIFEKNNQDYININNSIYGPYDYAGITILEDDNESFVYQKNETWYTFFNGEILEGDVNILTSKNYLLQNFNLQDPLKETIVINGTTYGPYQNIYNYGINDSIWAIAYIENDKAYIQTNKDKYGPFEMKNNEGHLYGTADFQFGDSSISIMEPVEDKYRILINGEDKGLINTSYKVQFHKDNWIMIYQEDDNSFLNYNGEIYPIHKESVNIITKGDNWSFIDENESGKLFNLNGKQFGPFDQDTYFELMNNNWAEITKDGDHYSIVLHEI